MTRLFQSKVPPRGFSRRRFIQASAAVGVGLTAPGLWTSFKAFAAPLAPGLSDPAIQPKFVNPAPNALDPGFRFLPNNVRRSKLGKLHKTQYDVTLKHTVQYTGLVAPDGVTPLPTRVFGYGPTPRTAVWPGLTFEVQSGEPIEVTWKNKLHYRFRKDLRHLLPVDTSTHWAYSMPGYEGCSIEADGVPIITHLHGGHTDSDFDGNPEQFYSPGYKVRGPRWPGTKFTYNNDQPAGNLWYHDHALGLTRLNVYAGLAGFYFIRDNDDTGKRDNPLGLPAFPYELAYAIQDRMFRQNGQLFYPAYPGDPFYDDFIVGEGADLPPSIFPGGGPTALAEFFGDHMVVNGMIWPKTNVEPRHYRIRLLNGTDSRFMVIRFRAAASPESTDLTGAGTPIPFYVIGSDQGLAAAATLTDTLVFEPGGRYDIVIDFSDPVFSGKRIIMENAGGDAPFGGDFDTDLPPDDLFPDRQTDRIMAFDVVLPFDMAVADAFDPSAIGHYGGNTNPVDNVRKVALFEGRDEFGRLQPLLGTAEPTVDASGNLVSGAIAWHAPTTENPALGTTEIWEIYNATGDAHPVHLHQVNFQILDRHEFTADLIGQPVLQHNGALGAGFRLENIATGAPVAAPAGYIENAPKDMVTALPEQVTRIKMTFDLPGRYVWHCHILSHEDHEMMRVLHVGSGAND